MINTIDFTAECSCCNKTITIKDISIHALKRWKEGELIQKAFPSLNAGEREFLRIQICEPCFDEMFKEEEE